MTNNKLKISCYTHLKVWTIHVNKQGDLNFNRGLLVCEDVKYVGEDARPDFDDDMARLETNPTTIRRIEFGIAAWASIIQVILKRIS